MVVSETYPMETEMLSNNTVFYFFFIAAKLEKILLYIWKNNVLYLPQLAQMWQLVPTWLA